MLPTVADIERDLLRIGGIQQALQLLRSAKPGVAENAALILSNAVQSKEEFAASVLASQTPQLWHKLKNFLDSDDVVLKASSTGTIAAFATLADEYIARLPRSQCDLPQLLNETGILDSLCDNLAQASSHSMPMNDDILISATTLSVGSLMYGSPPTTQKVVSAGGVQTLFSLLSRKGQIQEYALAAIANGCEADMSFCKEVVDKNLWPTLITTGKEALAVGSMEKQDSLSDPVNDTDRLVMVEHALTALAFCAVAESAISRDLHRRGGLDLIVNALKSESLDIQAAAVISMQKVLNASLSHSGSILSHLRRSGCLLKVTKLVSHSLEEVSSAAIDCLNQLLEGDGEALLPVIEQGCVPTLYSYYASPHQQLASLATGVVKKLRDSIRGPVLHLLMRTLNMEGNESLRINIAVALVYLSFGAPKLRTLFAEEGGLDSILDMLRMRGAGPTAVGEFLSAILPLVQMNVGGMSAAEEKALLEDTGVLATTPTDLAVFVGPNRERFCFHMSRVYLSSEAPKDTSGEVSMPDGDPLAVERLFKFIYSDNCLSEQLLDAGTSASLLHLLQVAVKLKFSQQVRKLSLLLAMKLTSDNINNIFQQAVSQGPPELTLACFRFIAGHANQLAQRDESARLVMDELLKEFLSHLLHVE